ncbi:hypothetical protein ASE92_01325 [Pedobacter sp. Leaf41]|nr:hypothetical protein ASE92_01325 [Pedobacter sp. Leaf41]
MITQLFKFSILSIALLFALESKIKAQEVMIPVDSIKNFDFNSIEKPPEYPGGLQKFYQYLGRNTKYPKQAWKDRIGGAVTLSFVVERSGDLTEVMVVSGLRKDIDEEAIRVVSKSPKWNPGIQDGKPVRVKYNIKVNFSPN